MICYKDMTFCKYSNCKKWDECHRALTPKIKAAAEKWWGDKNYPIALFAELPECFEVKDE